MRALKIFMTFFAVFVLLGTAAFGIELKGEWVSVEHYMGGSEMPFLVGKSVFTFAPGNTYVHNMGGFSKEEGSYKVVGDNILFTLPDGSEKKAIIQGDKFIVINDLTKVKIVYAKKE